MNQELDIFKMFNIVGDYQEKKKEKEKKKKEEEKKRQETENKQKSKKSKSDNEFDIDQNTVIRYFGQTFPVVPNYFTEEEVTKGILKKTKNGEKREKINEEALRKRMEKDFPELIKGKTDMIYIKEKNIVVPILKAKEKGSSEAFSGLTDPNFKIKIPFSILRSFIAVAKLYADAGSESYEVHGDIYLSSSTGEYFLDIPQQKVSFISCEVTEKSDSILERVGYDAIKVMEIHSHHYFAPTPSARDNLSETVPGMYYTIVGSLLNPFPEIIIRRKCVGEGWTYIPLERIFGAPKHEDDPFDIYPLFNPNRVKLMNGVEEK